jgi:hypothetical protein
MSLDRRRFLQLTALGVAGAVAGSACASGRDKELGAQEPADLLRMLGPDRVRQLGAHYRAATPSDTALRTAMSDTLRAGSPTSSPARESTQRQIRDDFAAGRTVLVDGWVLSATEARQAALFSLKHF